MNRDKGRDWRQLAAGMLENERKMQPMHRPPSTGCLVNWRDQVRVGCIQYPVDPAFPAIVFVSITSRFLDPEYIRAIRNLDPGRLELTADDAIDLTGNFHILRREQERLTCMTPEETRHMASRRQHLIQLSPTADGVHFESIAAPELKLYRRGFHRE